MKNKYAYFIGCTIPFRASNYDLATRKVTESLGIELVDLPDAGCCGLYFELINEMTYLSMAARVLSMAEEKKLDLLVLCNGCNGSLYRANKKLKENPELKDKVNEVLTEVGREYRGTIEVKHLIRVLYEDIGIEKIKEKIANPLTNVKAAAHYGCHLLKPSEEIMFDDPKNPVSLDRLIEVTGAKSVDYYDKLQCCGGYVLAADAKTAYKMTGEKLSHVKAAGADIMITGCPFCNVMYDANQRAAETETGQQYKIPCLHYPQLLALAMGVDPKELGFEQNRVRPDMKLFIKSP
ncbi:MAG: CoB--CoM heterodisulfide reductase iron-sulfur subunit B family protein [Candidatus Altiarchaeia archaeon]